MICKSCGCKIEYGDEYACIYNDEIFCSYECMQPYVDYYLPNYNMYTEKDWNDDSFYDTDNTQKEK